MKHYKLIRNFQNYGFYEKEKIYPENFEPPPESGTMMILSNVLKYNPDDWVEVKIFRYGK